MAQYEIVVCDNCQADSRVDDLEKSEQLKGSLHTYSWSERKGYADNKCRVSAPNLCHTCTGLVEEALEAGKVGTCLCGRGPMQGPGIGCVSCVSDAER